MALSSSVNLALAAQQSASLDLGSAAFSVSKTFGGALASGTGAGQADKLWTDTRTLAASATEDLDLAGVLVDAFGTTTTFVKVKAVIVAAAAANTNNVNLTRPASNGVPLFLAAGDGIAVRPGGMVAIFAPDATGYAVTAATGDLLTLTNSAGTTSVTYDVVIIGTSA